MASKVTAQLHDESCKYAFEQRDWSLIPPFCTDKRISQKVIDKIPKSLETLKQSAIKAKAACDHFAQKQAKLADKLASNPCFCSQAYYIPG